MERENKKIEQIFHLSIRQKNMIDDCEDYIIMVSQSRLGSIIAALSSNYYITIK